MAELVPKLECTREPGWTRPGPSAKRMFIISTKLALPSETSFKSYDKARQIKKSQDAYCEKALASDWNDLGAFPEELQWEALVDVLRGHVKVQTHCYEAVDFDSFIRVSYQLPLNRSC